jgi:hypothetical protein
VGVSVCAGVSVSVGVGVRGAVWGGGGVERGMRVPVCVWGR